MSQIEIIFEDVSSNNDFLHFNCGDPIINSQISYYAYRNNIMKTGHSCKAILDNRVVGCFMVEMASISIDEDEEDYYVINLCILAVDEQFQNSGVGTNILKYIIKESKMAADFCGIRGLILTPKPDKIEWYKNRGFNKYREDNNDIRMFIDWRDNEFLNEYISE